MRTLLLPLLVLAACAHSEAPRMPVPVKPTPSLVEPMSKLSFMRGIWIGEGSGTLPDGRAYTVTQTERMGPMLGGDVVVIEGRGYNADGTTGFNALGIVSWEPHAQRYEIRSYAQGRSGTFELKLTETGYIWETPAGPGAVVRFTATVQNNHWREVGEYIAEGRPPVKTFEMNLTKQGDTDWPLGVPVQPPAK